jgi:DNA-directed RNA polymerase specialized sigma24 family protein
MSKDEDGRRSDARFLERARSGDEASFVEFAARWWAPVSRISWNMLGNVPEAAAVTEEVLLTSLRAPKPARGRLEFSMYRLAIRLCIARRRSGLRAHGRPTQLHQALDELKDLDRAALVLCDGEGLEVDEAGLVLEASPEETRARVHLARALLTGLLETDSARLATG